MMIFRGYLNERKLVQAIGRLLLDRDRWKDVGNDIIRCKDKDFHLICKYKYQSIKEDMIKVSVVFPTNSMSRVTWSPKNNLNRNLLIKYMKSYLKYLTDTGKDDDFNETLMHITGFK